MAYNHALAASGFLASPTSAGSGAQMGGGTSAPPILALMTPSQNYAQPQSSAAGTGFATGTSWRSPAAGGTPGGPLASPLSSPLASPLASPGAPSYAGGGGGGYAGAYSGMAGSPSMGGYGGGDAGMAGMGAPPVTDARRNWELNSLASKLADMQVAVAQADEALSVKGSNWSASFDPSSMDGVQIALSELPPGTTVDEFGNIVPPPPQIVLDELPHLALTGGFVHRKAGTKSRFLSTRTWSQVYMRLEELNLVFYDKPESTKATSYFAMDADTVLVQSDPDKPHRNKNVKFDFTVTNGTGESISLYCDTMEQANAWMSIIDYVVARIQEATYYAAHPEVLQQAAEAAVASAAMNAAAASTRSGGAAASGFGGSGGGGGSGSGALGSADEPVALTPAEEAQRDEAHANTVYGPGLYEAVRGERASFVIHAHDATGVPKADGGDAYSVTLINDELHVEVVPVDMGDGTYLVEYTPTRAGDYELSVMLGGRWHILGSPFQVYVQRAPTAASHCLLEGAGATTAVAGSTNVFTLTARDQFDDPRQQGGDVFELVVAGPATAHPIVDNGDGTYTVSYTVDTAGAEAALSLAASHAALRRYGAPHAAPLEIGLFLNNPGFPYPRPVAGTPLRPHLVLPADAADNSNNMSGSAVAARLEAAAYAASSPRLALPPAAPSTPAAPAATQQEKEELEALKQSLAAKEAHMEESMRSLDEMKRKLEEDRAVVDRQMARVSELGRRVKEDSEKLAEQARVLRSAASPLATPSSAVASPLRAVAPARAPGAGSASISGSDMLASSYTSAGGMNPPNLRSNAGATPVALGRAPGVPSQHVVSVSDVPPPPPPPSLSSAAPAVAMPSVAPAASPAVSSPLSRPADDVAPPAELLSSPVIAVFDAHKQALYALWEFYTRLTEQYAEAEAGVRPQVTGIDAARFTDMFCDFDIVPTFLNRREVKTVFDACARAHANLGRASSDKYLPYSGFVEALGRVALMALSNPTFQSLYPTAKDKVLVLLQMWGMADPEKLREVQRIARPMTDDAASLPPPPPPPSHA